MNFKQKNIIIKQIARDYKKTKFLFREELMVREESSSYLDNRKDLNYYKELKEKIDYILIQMDNNLSKVIYNEYFSNRNEDWWMFYYSKSTYYRLKNKAMDSFLEWWYV